MSFEIPGSPIFLQTSITLVPRQHFPIGGPSPFFEPWLNKIKPDEKTCTSSKQGFKKGTPPFMRAGISKDPLYESRDFKGSSLREQGFQRDPSLREQGF
jgi:uncharacterized protein YodC (DUF2158 family)